MTPSNDEAASEFEKAWKNLKAPMNETITSKWFFKKGFESGSAFTLQEILNALPPEKTYERTMCMSEEQYVFGYNLMLKDIRALIEKKLEGKEG